MQGLRDGLWSSQIMLLSSINLARARMHIFTKRGYAMLQLKKGARAGTRGAVISYSNFDALVPAALALPTASKCFHPFNLPPIPTTLRSCQPVNSG